ncbi:hypothetical protein D3C78_1153390 [compost metagenome]
MTKGDLITAGELGMRAHQNGNLLALFTNGFNQTCIRLFGGWHAIGYEGRIDIGRIERNDRETFCELPFDLFRTLGAFRYLAERLADHSHRGIQNIGHEFRRAKDGPDTRTRPLGCGLIAVGGRSTKIGEYLFSAHAALPHAFLISPSISAFTLFMASSARS